MSSYAQEEVNESPVAHYSLPAIGAIVIHAIVAVALIGSWSFSKPKSADFQIPEHIIANVVTVEKPTPAPVKPKPQPKPAPQPKPVVKETPKPEVAPKPEPAPVVETPAPVEQKQAEPVAQAEPEPEIPALPSEEELLDDLFSDLQAETAAINERVAENEAQRARQAEINASVEDYRAQITRQIEEKWSRPVGLIDLSALEAKVIVELLPSGELRSARISQSSGNARFDDSILRAIDKVGRFSVPADSITFEQGGFRRLNITFKPEDLM
ncbi:energy transducer TonB [Reinekea thalattae]|uniref:TonB family protein n=1 Tax=Reinekea thalattae TaxID=2593301 RepID=A0A5C8Z7U3_9GAMM|nr:TonB family protein [Reinekea thalattae]TXR54022.1 TonB family protein [Reinekea thalattae]